MAKKKRVTFYIDERLHRNLNIDAVSSDPKRSMSKLVEDLVRDYLRKRAQQLGYSHHSSNGRAMYRKDESHS